MQINSSGLVNQSNLVRNEQQQITGVKTAAGTEAKVVDPTQIPTQVAKGDLFVKVGDNQVVQLTLSEPASREELMAALSQAIDQVPEGEVALKEGMIKAYISMANAGGNIPTGSALATRVAELEKKLAGGTHPTTAPQTTGHGDKTEGHSQPSPLSEALKKYLTTHYPNQAIELAHFEHALHALHEGKYVEGMGQLIISLQHAGHHSHAIMEGLEHALKPIMDKMETTPQGKALKSILNKTFFDMKNNGAEALGRLKHLEVLLNGKGEFKDMRALFEVLNTYGTDIKALLPEKAREAVERLETKLGAALPDVVKKLLPTMQNADFSKAVLKFVFASDNIGRTAAVINFMGAVGKTFLKDNQTFNAVAALLKMDTHEEAAWGKLFKPEYSAADKTTAMQELSNIYKIKLDQFTATMNKIETEAAASATTGATTGLEETSGRVGGEVVQDGAQYSGKVGEGMRAIDELGTKVSKETREAMQGLLTKIVEANPEISGEALRDTIRAMEKLGLQSADNALALLAHMPPDIASKIMTSKQGLNVLIHAADKMMPYMLEKLGKAGEAAGKALMIVAPRLASSIVKAIPVIGVIPAVHDAARLQEIALKGVYRDDHGKVTQYKDKDVRAMALLGSITNEADAALALFEAAGIGHVALPLQLGLAAGSLTLDMMVEYYNAHPEEMTPQLRGAIKAATMTASLMQHPAAKEVASKLYGADTVGKQFEALYDGLVAAGVQGDHLTNALKIAIAKSKAPGALDEAMLMLAKKGKDKMGDLAKWALETGQTTMDKAIKWVGETKAYEIASDLVKSGKATIADLAKWFGETKAVTMMVDLVKSGAVKTVDVAKSLAKMGADEAKLFGAFMVDLGKATGKTLMEVGADIADIAKTLGDKALQTKMMQGVLDFAQSNITYYKVLAEHTIKSFIEKGIDVADTIVDFAVKRGAEGAELVNKALTAIDQSKLGEVGKRVYAAVSEGIKSFLNPVLKNTDEIAAFVSKMNLGDEAAEGLKKVIGHLDPEDVGPALKALEKVGAEHLDDVLRMMSHLPSGMVAKAFKYAPGIMTDFSEMMVKAIGSRLGKAALHSPELLAKMAGKIGAGLGKAIPLLGVAVSAYDTGRAASIFATGNGMDLFTLQTKHYNNAHARGIAAMLTVINAGDTALGIADLIPGVNAGSVAAGVGLAVTSTVLDITMDYIEDNPGALGNEPLASFKSTIEVGSLAAAAVMGAPALYQMIKLYGSNAEQAGKAIAQALLKSKDAPDIGKTITELNSMIKADSGGLWGDDMTRAIFRELKANGVTLKDLMNPQGRPNPYEDGKRLPPLGAQSIDLLMDNLEEGWTTAEEYDYLDQMAEVAPLSSKARMTERILGDWFNGDRSEQLLTKLLPKDSAQLNRMLKDLSPAQMTSMGSVLSDNQTRFNDIFRRIADSGSEDKLKAFIQDISAAQLEKAVTDLLSKGGSLSANERFMLLEKALSAGNATLANKLLPANSGELNKVLEKLSATQVESLGSVLQNDPAQFNDAFQKIANSGSEGKLKSFIKTASAEQLDKAVTAMVGKGGTLSNNERFMLFEKAVEAGNYSLMDKMLNGTGGMGRMADKATQEKMIGLLSKDINHFMSVFGGQNNVNAGKISSWILAYGSQSQIDQVFSNINSTYKSWFGNGGEIVKNAIDFAISKGMKPSELSGKLSLSTLNSMVGSLNGTWTKMFGDYQTNIKYVGYLAQMTNVDGKAAIVKNLMDGWTPGEAETLIHDIFRDTTDWKQFTQLVDKVGPAKISSELEDRAELGKVMAFIVERYDKKYSVGGRDQDVVLREVMNQWASTSVKSDDYIYHMLKQLEKDGKLQNLKDWVDNGTLDIMVDWTDDAFRDRNVYDLDPESQWSIDILKWARN